MAAASQCSTAAPSVNKRFVWTAHMTNTLIDIWEDHLAQLRAQKHNASVYGRITDLFNAAVNNAGDGVVTVKQVRHKLENLAQVYRKESRRGTGSAGVSWPYYFRLHSFLGSLPSNDATLVEESMHLDVVTEAVEGAEVVTAFEEPPAEMYSGLAASTSTEDQSSSLCPTSNASATESDTASGSLLSQCRPRICRGRKRPQNSSLEKVMDVFAKESKKPRKLAKKELELTRRGIRLQEEANEMQREMINMMADYFQSRSTTK